LARQPVARLVSVWWTGGDGGHVMMVPIYSAGHLNELLAIAYLFDGVLPWIQNPGKVDAYGFRHPHKTLATPSSLGQHIGGSLFLS
jgi:hypothetical protein